MSVRSPGRIRVHLAHALETAMPHVSVDPTELYEAKGHYRTSPIVCYRWEGLGRLRELPNVIVAMYSYSTMGDCVRRGVDCVFQNTTSVDVYPKGKSK